MSLCHASDTGCFPQVLNTPYTFGFSQVKSCFVTSDLSLLELDSRTPFNIGGTRRCYVHPDDPDKCVKVLRPDRTAERRKATVTGWRKFKPLSSFDDQLKEQRAYEQICRAKDPRIFNHVPRYYGVLQTDLGVGIVTQLYRNFDGKFPVTLEELLLDPVSKSLERAVAEFKDWLRSVRFLTRDLLPHNIIAVWTDPGSVQLVIVDGLGNSEFVPISNWFGSVASRKIDRKIEKFEIRTGLRS